MIMSNEQLECKNSDYTHLLVLVFKNVSLKSLPKNPKLTGKIWC